MRSKTLLVGVGVVIGLLLAAAGIVVAGSLSPGAGPTEAGSQMYTVEQIYTRLMDGGDATKMAAFTEPGSGPTAGTMHTLDELYALALPARVPKTGQTQCYDIIGNVIACAGTGQDGALQKGVAWPSPRFTDDGNGTVTDNLTGLIWLKDADCIGPRAWVDALTQVANLNSGTDFGCDNYTASTLSDWRLPNVREQLSLFDYGRSFPALPSGHPFTGVPSFSVRYWTSTTHPESKNAALDVYSASGTMSFDGKTSTNIYVWPVRGGQ